MSLLSREFMIDSSVLTLIGSDPPSFSDSSNVKGEWLTAKYTLVESRQVVLHERMWDVLKMTGMLCMTLSNSDGVLPLLNNIVASNNQRISDNGVDDRLQLC